MGYDDQFDLSDEPTIETRTIYCEPSWSQRAEERLRGQDEEYARWHLEHFGYPLQKQKHISDEEIHAEKDRMLQEQAEVIEQLNQTIYDAAKYVENRCQPGWAAPDGYTVIELLKILNG